MRALIAESNAVTRASLRRILERSDFDVEELRDELAAACLLHQPGAPELALLAVDTMLADFGQVCSVMREAKPDVYIVALVPQDRRIRVSSVLDAGADDFLIKPVSLQEAEGRVRVIQNVLTERAVQRIDEGEGEGQGEVDGGDTTERQDVTDGDTESSESARILRTPRTLLEELTSATTLTSVFEHMGLAPVEELPADEAGAKGVFSVWSPLLVTIQDHAHWVNARIDLDAENARQLFGVVERYGTFSEDRLLRVLQDIMDLVQDGIRTRAEDIGGADLHIPITPVTRPTAQIPTAVELSGYGAERKVMGLRLKNDLRLLMTVTLEPIRREEPMISDLRPLDVLATDVHSAEYQIMLLRAGTMLNDDYIQKIRAFIRANNLSEKLEVFHPPDGTAAFLNEIELDVEA